MGKIVSIALAMAIVVTGGYLYAQDQEDQVADPEGVVGLEAVSDMSPLRMIEEADKLLKKMRFALQNLVKVQQVARKKKDVIKLNCVNDKLLQVKQLMNIAESSRTNLDEAIALEDKESRGHEYGKLVITEEQVRLLVEEAKNCIGDELIYIGPTEVDVDGPEVEEPGPDSDINPYVEPPAYASPFA